MLTLEVSMDGWEQSVLEWAESLRVPVQDAMAVRLSDIVLQNFGDDGIDRPEPWPELGMSYALRYHDGDRTPREILTGDLISSINVSLGNPEHSSVFSDVEYSASQQWGGLWNGRAIPPRPFFPLIGGPDDAVLTPFSEAELHAAAVQAISDKINSH